MLSGTRLLIVEEEFLIALDIQRVLEGTNAQPAVFARDFLEVEKLLDRIKEFDLAIVTAPHEGSGDMAIAEELLNAGLAIVVCSAARGSVANTALAEAEIVDKPFSDEALLAACQRALARRATVRESVPA